MLKNYSFIHIPKTAGSSIELDAKTLKLELVVAPKYALLPNIPKRWPAPWHHPADVFEKRFNMSRSPNHKPLLCVVRNPIDRLESEVNYQVTRFKRSGSNVIRETMIFVREILRAPSRFSIPITQWGPRSGRLVHLIPQHWFVWDDDGSLRCKCVVSFEKLNRLNITKHVWKSKHDIKIKWSKELNKLYKIDEILWKRAKKTHSLCYTPCNRMDMCVNRV